MSVQPFTLSNLLLRQFIAAIEHVIGTIGLNAVLRRAAMEEYIAHLPPHDAIALGDAHDYARLNKAIMDFFGRGSPAILRHIGQVLFDQLLEQQFAAAVWQTLDTQLTTDAQKFQAVLDELAQISALINPAWQIMLQSADNDTVDYAIANCPVCAGQTSDSPACHVYVGLITAMISYATHRPCRVEETQCTAMGAPHCHFLIQPALPNAPLDTLVLEKSTPKTNVRLL